MTRKPDIVETSKALVAELRRLPGSEQAILHLADLTKLMARRTKYLNLRAGLITTVISFLVLVGSNVASNGWADIPVAKIVFLTICYVLVLAVVLVLDDRLQRRPLSDD